jgi:hypothetical protein
MRLLSTLLLGCLFFGNMHSTYAAQPPLQDLLGFQRNSPFMQKPKSRSHERITKLFFMITGAVSIYYFKNYAVDKVPPHEILSKSAATTVKVAIIDLFENILDAFGKIQLDTSELGVKIVEPGVIALLMVEIAKELRDAWHLYANVGTSKDRVPFAVKGLLSLANGFFSGALTNRLNIFHPPLPHSFVMPVAAHASKKVIDDFLVETGWGTAPKINFFDTLYRAGFKLFCVLAAIDRDDSSLAKIGLVLT